MVLFMGNITVSLEKSAEQKLRAIASQKYKNRKGALSKVITESLNLFSRQSARQRAMERQFRWMDKGFEMGKILAKKREEIYDRG
jgi:hypothetical protein